MGQAIQQPPFGKIARASASIRRSSSERCSTNATTISAAPSRRRTVTPAGNGAISSSAFGGVADERRAGRPRAVPASAAAASPSTRPAPCRHGSLRRPPSVLDSAACPRDAAGAVCGDRPRALVVGGGAAAGRADEARPRASSLPRQVRPAARRGVPPAPLPAGRLCLRPVLRLGNHARRGERLRLRGRRLRHLGVQLPARAREDRPPPAADTRARAARDARAGAPRRGRVACEAAGEWLRRWYCDRARSASCSPTVAAAERLDAAGCATSPGSCCPAQRARHGSRPTSTSTSRPRPCRPRTGATSTSAPAGPCDEAAKFLRRYTDDTIRRLREFARAPDRRADSRSFTTTRERSSSRAGRPGSSPHRRTPG